MIVSAMKPPYDINSNILKLITYISEKLGEVNANFLNRPSPQLRKQNKIKTIHSSLKIEGNTLTEEQITALIENKSLREEMGKRARQYAETNHTIDRMVENLVSVF